MPWFIWRAGYWTLTMAWAELPYSSSAVGQWELRDCVPSNYFFACISLPIPPSAIISGFPVYHMQQLVCVHGFFMGHWGRPHCESNLNKNSRKCTEEPVQRKAHSWGVQCEQSSRDGDREQISLCAAVDDFSFYSGRNGKPLEGFKQRGNMVWL